MKRPSKGSKNGSKNHFKEPGCLSLTKFDTWIKTVYEKQLIISKILEIFEQPSIYLYSKPRIIIICLLPQIVIVRKINNLGFYWYVGGLMEQQKNIVRDAIK